MKTQPELSIIIINWKSKDYLQKCLASIEENNGTLSCEVVVLDNASFDGSDQLVKDCFPWVRFIQSQENLGFAKANNLAAKSAMSDVFLFLNPDTEICGDALVQMLNAVKSLPNAGVVGAYLLNTDGTYQTSSISYFPRISSQILNSELALTVFPRSRLWGERRMVSKKPEILEVEAISGACMMMKRAVFEGVEGFSTQYFMYTEDIDLCAKVRNAGFLNYHVAEARVVHHGGGSSKSERSMFSIIMTKESVRRYFHSSRGGMYALLYRVVMAFTAVMRLALLGLVALPMLVRSGGARRLWYGLRKWAAILRWSLGFERWVHRLAH